MDYALYALIVGFSSASYGLAIQNILRGNYRPNVFSRAVWLVLSINSLVGVIYSHSTPSSILLASILLLGSIGMFFTSIPNGRRSFGVLELLCCGLLLISGIIWLFYNFPLINVALSLAAHLIGAAPTYKQVWLKPTSESKKFWGFFFVASLLSLLAGLGQPWSKQLVPLYFTVFDGSIFLLSLRTKATD